MFGRVFGKSRDAVTWEDVEDLVRARTEESGFLDFKEQLPTGADDGYRETARDISAFANVGGGLIVFGIAEDDDRASAICPVPLGEKFESMLKAINTFLFPVSPGIQWCLLRKDDQAEGVAILEIPASSLAPHAVREKNGWSYWRRSGRSKHLMDEAEIERTYRRRSEVRQRIEDTLDRLVSDARIACPHGGLVLAATPPTGGRLLYTSPREGLQLHQRLLSLPSVHSLHGDARGELGEYAVLGFRAVEGDSEEKRVRLHTQAQRMSIERMWWSRVEQDGGIVIARSTWEANEKTNELLKKLGVGSGWYTTPRWLETSVVAMLIGLREICSVYSAAGSLYLRCGLIPSGGQIGLLWGDPLYQGAAIGEDCLLTLTIAVDDLFTPSHVLEHARDIMTNLYAAFGQLCDQLLVRETEGRLSINCSRFAQSEVRSMQRWCEAKGLPTSER